MPIEAHELHVGASGVPVRNQADKLFEGLATPRQAFIPESTEGRAHIQPEDTDEADYGLLLNRAYAKGLASPTGFEPVF